MQLGYRDFYLSVLGYDLAYGSDDFIGFHLGYDFDAGPSFWGVELDYDDIADGLLRLKLRSGSSAGNTLFYGTAGVARLELGLFDDIGYLVGIGSSYAVGDRWSFGSELLYHEFSDYESSGLDIDGTTLSLRASYRF